jgi:predicted nucleic acid-binding protein
LQDIVPVSVVEDDPDDDKILACAKAASADYVIAEDWHLLKIKHWSGINIVTPEQFLRLARS